MFCTMAPFVIYANFESIFEPLGRQVKQILTLSSTKCAPQRPSSAILSVITIS